MWSKSIEMFNPYEALMESYDMKKRGGRNIYRPFTGDQREVRRFAWYPITINGSTYWLKWITIRQSYDTRHSGWCNDWVVEK